MKLSNRDIEGLYKQYFRQLCIYSLHITENVGASEDIVQEAFVGLWNHRETVKDVRSYLFSSVRNGSLTYLRRSNPSMDILNVEITDETLEKDSEIEVKMWSAIEALPMRRREILLMSKRDGMKYEDIAIKLGISVNTVKNQISKALKDIKEIPLKIYSFFFAFG
ncbi:MAG: sigma-70 family RNA polymerase sigma factor [Bacteroidales bacterium]|nr:sigma-70 family RNA polymerase sigma factor [Bacteroidales bacterium]